MKTILFISDIEGTFTPEDINSDIEKRKAYNRFTNLLVEIKKRYEADQVIFSLATSHSQPFYIKHCLTNVKEPFEKNNVMVGKCFLDKMSYQDGECVLYPKEENSYKLFQVTNYVNQLKENNIDVVWFGFADDTLGKDAQLLFKDIMKNDIPYDVFTPGQNFVSENNLYCSKQRGINGLNECLISFVGNYRIEDEEEIIEVIEENEVIEETKDVGFVKRLIRKFNLNNKS